MALIKDGQPVQDPWIALPDDMDLPSSGPVIVSLARWQAEREALSSRGEPIGVRLASHESASDIAPDLDRIALVAVEFPTFRDGRAYSTARLLRERHGFKGELRAVGDVLRDQLLFMTRCGFDAFEIASEDAVESWRKAMEEFSFWYQPATDGRVPVTMLRHMRRAAE
jgi:uncharacterized protein (DUF934 family)